MVDGQWKDGRMMKNAYTESFRLRDLDIGYINDNIHSHEPCCNEFPSVFLLSSLIIFSQSENRKKSFSNKVSDEKLVFCMHK